MALPWRKVGVAPKAILGDHPCFDVLSVAFYDRMRAWLLKMAIGGVLDSLKPTIVSLHRSSGAAFSPD